MKPVPPASGLSGAAVLSSAAVVTSDPHLLRWVQGCAAGSGARVRPLPPDAAAHWREHPLVLVGPDAAAELVRSGAPRHPHAHLVAPVGADADALRAGVALGVRSVLDPDTDGDRVAALLAAVADPREPGRVLAVTAGSGGAGATTTAAALALLAADDLAVALVATDPRAPDVHLLLGSEPDPGLTWADLTVSRGRVGPVALRESLAHHRGVAVLDHGSQPGGPGVRTMPDAQVVRHGLESLQAAFDLVVVDVGTDTGPVGEEAVARADRTWMVVRPGVLPLASARGRIPRLGPGVRVLVRGEELPSAAVAAALDLDPAHLLRMKPERRLDEWLDVGAGPLPRRRTPLRNAARAVLVDVLSDEAAEALVPGRVR